MSALWSRRNATAFLVLYLTACIKGVCPSLSLASMSALFSSSNLITPGSPRWAAQAKAVLPAWSLDSMLTPRSSSILTIAPCPPPAAETSADAKALLLDFVRAFRSNNSITISLCPYLLLFLLRFRWIYLCSLFWHCAQVAILPRACGHSLRLASKVSPSRDRRC